MALAQGTEIKLKKYEWLNDDDSLLMHVNALPSKDQAVIALQSQVQAVGQNANINVTIVSWKTNYLTYYKSGSKGYLAQTFCIL